MMTLLSASEACLKEEELFDPRRGEKVHNCNFDRNRIERAVHRRRVSVTLFLLCSSLRLRRKNDRSSLEQVALTILEYVRVFFFYKKTIPKLEDVRFKFFKKLRRSRKMREKI